MRTKELKYDREFAEKAWDMVGDKNLDVLVIQGQRITERNLVYVEEKLFDESRRLGMGDVILGNFKGKKFAFSSGFGPSILADMTHLAILLGVKYVILVGTCGGLNMKLDRRDVVLPKIVANHDGVSDWYMRKDQLITTSEKVRKELVGGLDFLGIKYREVNTISVSSMLMENRELINFWSESNLYGVDMEASAVFAVANYFGVSCGGLLFVIDNIIKEKDVVDFTDEDKELDVKYMYKMIDVAFYSGLNLLMSKN